MTRYARAPGVLCTILMSRFIVTGLLVDAVQYKPCLWGASNINYKNKDARARAWKVICDEMFEGLSQEEKQKLGKKLRGSSLSLWFQTHFRNVLLRGWDVPTHSFFVCRRRLLKIK